MTDEQIQTFVDYVEWVEIIPPLVLRGEVDEVRPYRPAILNDEELMPF